MKSRIGLGDLTPDEMFLYRRAIMVAIREALPVKLIAHTVGVTTALIYKETNQGYPADLDPDLLLGAIVGTRRAIRDRAEGRWRYPGR